MAMLFGSRVNSKTPPATSMRIQTALNGTPIPILHGRQRLACNLLDYVKFTYEAGSGKGSSGGGKGGVLGGGKGGVLGGGKGSGGPKYTADVVAGLCEGPIIDIGTVWASQSIETMSQAGIGWEAGAPGQAPFGFLSANFPGHALGYSWLALVGASPLNLGSSPEMPNLNFEVTGAIACAVTETWAIAAPYTMTPRYFTLAASVTEQVTIPATVPSHYQAQNPGAQTLALVLRAGGLIDAADIPGSASQGVIDENGRVFTRVTGTPTSGQYAITANSVGSIYTFAAADAGLQVTVIDLAVGPGVHYCYEPTGTLTAGSAVISSLSSTANLVAGQRVLGTGIPPGTVAQSVGSGIVTLSEAATASAAGATLTFVGNTLDQVLGTPATGQFSVSVQPGAYGQYQFASADNGKSVLIVDVPDAVPSQSLTDYLSNPRYGCGFPAANIGDLSALDAYAFSAGLFVSAALTASQAANSYLGDFSTGLNGEFVWSAGLLTFVPYGDTAIGGFGRVYTPPGAPVYALDDDDFLKNEGTSSVGVSAFTSDDPVVCVRSRPSDAYNDVKVEYLDRGNSYNPAIVEVQNDAAITAYGLRPQDTKQLHFFCDAAAATMSAQLQLGRQQVRNLYSFTVPWYFILLDPMDIIAISDPALGLDEEWVRVTEITENQEDGTLTITAEEYLQGAGWAPPSSGGQRGIGAVPNVNATPASVN